MQQEKFEDGQTRLTSDFRIKEWLVHPQLNRIGVGDEVIQVQPKIMEVLVCLAERQGQVATKEFLLQTVWAETHVTGHVLTRSISELRKIFRDRPQNPQIIETIPKTGYRLIAPVLREDHRTDAGLPIDPADNPQSTTNNSNHSQTGRSPGQVWRRASIAAGMVIVFLFVFLSVAGRFLHDH